MADKLPPDGDDTNATPYLPFDHFPRTPEQLARTEDPATSHAAAESIIEELPTIRRQVREVMLLIGPSTDDVIIRRYRAQFGWAKESTVRTRRGELVKLDLAYAVGKVPGVSRRLMTVWACR